MEAYVFNIKLQSALGTPLKGDTLFGCFCWQAAHDPELITGGLGSALAHYPARPFAVFSSAYPILAGGGWAIKRPDVPMSWFDPASHADARQRQERHKDLKNKKWIVLDKELELCLDQSRLLNDKELAHRARRDPGSFGRQGESHYLVTARQPHNTINRLTQTTGTGMFAPYSVLNQWYAPGAELALFVLLERNFTDVHCVAEALKRIGRFGFGRDSSTGKGRFALIDVPRQLDWPKVRDQDALLMLAPCVPAAGEMSRIWCSPFIRFGKHGDAWATGSNPFKAPVVMADEGAVALAARANKGYVGTAVTGVSRQNSATVVQGYAPCLPFQLEAAHERQC